MQKGLLTKELREVARKNGIALGTVYKRITVGNLTPMEAVTRPVWKFRNHFKANNSRYHERIKEHSLGFKYYRDDMDRFKSFVEKSDQSQAHFLCDALEYYLDHLEAQNEK